MAIRAAVAAGVNITYKILFNDAVAMTGGQPVEGHLTVPQITRQLAAEGVARIAVVTDEPEKHAAEKDFAPGVTVHHRRELQRVEERFRDIARRDRHRLRPDLRLGETPAAQARHVRRSAEARLHQRRRVRRLRRLLA